MKKLNEGPTIKTDHKGSHLTNADGEVVQSFGKDRAGLKAARQSMYKNYKGLNRKTPAPEPVEEPVEEDSAVDPRINLHRGEQVMKNNYRKNAGVDMPADKVAKMQSTRADWDADNEAKFGKFDWDKTPEFEKPNARALALNKQAKAARANFKSPTLTPQQRNTYKQSRNAQTAQANKQRVANGQTPFAMEDTITENTGGFEVRLDNGGKVSLGKHTFTYHVNDASEANTVARSAEKSGMTVLDIDSKEIRIDAQAFKHRGLVDSLQELQINGYITEDRGMSNLDKKLKEQLEESITVNTTSTNDDNVEDNVNVTATGADAMELIQMLKMAGIGAPQAQEVEAPAEEMPCMSQPNEIDSMRDMISNMDNVEVIALDDIEAVEEEAELANAPDEKYADTDTLVNKISGGLNRRKKAYAKAENGDNPMAVTESEEELTTRLLKEYDEFKVTAPADSEEGNWEIENVGKWAVKIGNTENVEATDGELDLPFDTDLASALADEAMTEVKKPDADGDGIPDWADKDEECKYCGGECPQDEEHACDGYLGDIDNLYADEELQEDDVEEGLRMEFPDGSCEGSKCPDDRNRRKKPKKLDTDTDALDDEMSEDKK